MISAGGLRRGFAGLGRVIDFLRTESRRSSAITSSLTPNCCEALAIDLDRVVFLPLFELAVGTIFGRVGARVAAVAIGQALDQRGALAGPRPCEGLLRGAVDDVGVVAVDDDALEAVGAMARSAAGCGIAVTSPIGVYSM